MRRICAEPDRPDDDTATRILRRAQDKGFMRHLFSRTVQVGTCHVWQGSSDGSGGRIGGGKTASGSCIPLFCHHIAFAWMKGRLPRKTLRNTCGTRRCLVHWVEVDQPTYLRTLPWKYWGLEKRRIGSCEAERIRALYPHRTLRDLAAIFGINRDTVHDIVRGRLYKRTGGIVCDLKDPLRRKA